MSITFNKIGTSGWHAGGRIRNARNYITASYEVYADKELIGYMSEQITGADIRTGWKFTSFNQPTFETDALNATSAKAEVKRHINNS